MVVGIPVDHPVTPGVQSTGQSPGLDIIFRIGGRVRLSTGNDIAGSVLDGHSCIVSATSDADDAETFPIQSRELDVIIGAFAYLAAFLGVDIEVVGGVKHERIISFLGVICAALDCRCA